MMDSPDLSPGYSPWDTNRTNRTRSSGGKYESAHFFTPAVLAFVEVLVGWAVPKVEISESCEDGMNVVERN